METIKYKTSGQTENTGEEDVKSDMKKMKVPNWKITVQDRTKWKGVVEKTKTLCEL
jgi:hypothetical protein